MRRDRFWSSDLLWHTAWREPHKSARCNMPSSSRSDRQAAMVTVQSVLGGVFFGIWVMVNAIAGSDLTGVLVQCLPYIVFFELGILSRYIPGVRDVAKRIA